MICNNQFLEQNTIAVQSIERNAPLILQVFVSLITALKVAGKIACYKKSSIFMKSDYAK